MRIRSKLLLVVLPLVVTPLLLLSLAAVFAARNGITQVAAGALLFKAEELRNYTETQWKLLENNKLAEDPAFVAVAKTAVESFARSLIRSQTEMILAMEASRRLAFRTAEVEPAPGELDRLAELAAAHKTGWQEVHFGGAEHVGQAILFEPFGWYLLVSEKRETFYQAVNQIVLQSGVLLLVTLVLQQLPDPRLRLIRRYWLYSSRSRGTWLRMPHLVRPAPEGWRQDHSAQCAFPQPR